MKFFPPVPRFPQLRFPLVPAACDRLVLTLLLAAGVAAVGLRPAPVWALPPDTAPAALTNLLGAIDAAASEGDLAAVMGFYSPAFTNEDGLTYEGLEDGLRQLWQRYPDLTYETRLLFWEEEGEALIAETETQIRGTGTLGDRDVTLTATVRSRQSYRDGLVVGQEILTEQTLVTSGDMPPTTTVNLPEAVRPGRTYYFDFIVREPLGDDVLLGTAFEEEVSADRYFATAPTDLQPLPAGGLFKQGRAAFVESDFWISGMVVRQGGMAIVTRRLRVVR